VLGVGTAGAVALSSLGSAPSSESVAVATNVVEAAAPVLDAGVPIDAPRLVDAAVVQPPVDAAVVVTTPPRRVTRSPAEPAKPPATVAKVPPKPAKPRVPLVCRRAQTCCIAIEGEGAYEKGTCSFQSSDAETCESALAELRSRATTGMHKKMCGV
jgi:hypothetical protein